MCRVLGVHRSWFYAWLKGPISDRSKKEDHRLLGLVRESYLASGKSYGSPRVHLTLWRWASRCGVKRVNRLMRLEGLKAHCGYSGLATQPGSHPAVAPNRSSRSLPHRPRTRPGLPILPTSGSTKGGFILRLL